MIAHILERHLQTKQGRRSLGVGVEEGAPPPQFRHKQTFGDLMQQEADSVDEAV
jgi:hypothetical protein